MSKSSATRANTNARKIAASLTIPSGATMRFSPTDAQKFARDNGADSYLLEDVDFPLLAEILNARMSPRKAKPRRAFNTYPSPQFNGSVLDVYRQPNPDPKTAKRTPVEKDFAQNFTDAERW